MNRFKLSLLSTLIGTTIFSTTTFAAAFQLYELGTPIIGTADVGQAAVAEDASTAYFNPAGMTLMKSCNNFMLGSQMLVTYANFSKNNSTTIAGDNGGNAGWLIPGMDLYYVYRYTPAWTFGVSLTSPFGGVLNYTDGWVGRYIVQGVMFYTINLNPSFAYRVNDWLSIGAGASIEYMNLQESVAFRILPLVDGQVKINVVSFAPGFNLGVMLTPYKDTKIGIAYRSQIVHHLHGDSTFLRIGAAPNTSTKMVMPANVIVSLAQTLSDKFNLLAELGWANWSTMRDTILTVDGLSATTPLDWKNTYRLGLGGQYKVNPCLMLQLGASYDSSPTTSSRRLPDLPMDRQIRIGAGMMYEMLKHVTVGASYEYINFGNANINNTSADGVLAGSYSRNYANAVQVSVSVEA